MDLMGAVDIFQHLTRLNYQEHIQNLMVKVGVYFLYENIVTVTCSGQRTLLREHTI